MTVETLSHMRIEIRPLRAEDWEAVRLIYLDGIATGQATFETSAPSWDSWNSDHLTSSRFVAVSDQTSVGWAALGPVSTRSAYAGVAEVSIYVASQFRGQGIGCALLERLIEEAERNGIWTLQASIFPENVASIALHKSCGFREVGVRERIGKLKGVWRNTVILERRSQLIGND